MTTTTERADALITDLPDLVLEFLQVLDAKERDRRQHVNARHLAQHGRLLYPEGSTYATYSVGSGGRKYLRVVQTVTGGQRSVHCFIDKATGDVLKAAGWPRPAAGVRFNLLDADSRADLFDRCEFAGGYLYRGAR